MSIVMYSVAAFSTVTGPALLAGTERTIGEALVTGTAARVAVAAALSLTTAILCWVGLSRFGVTPLGWAWCWASALGCGLALTDLRRQRLPFPLVAALAGGCAVFLLCATVAEGAWARFGVACISMLVVLGLASLVQAWAPEHTGGGDTALYTALALYLGWFGWDGLLRGLLIASGLTALVALAAAVSSKSMNSQFPAGPSLLAGALLSILVT